MKHKHHTTERRLLHFSEQLGRLKTLEKAKGLKSAVEQLANDAGQDANKQKSALEAIQLRARSRYIQLKKAPVQGEAQSALEKLKQEFASVEIELNEEDDEVTVTGFKPQNERPTQAASEGGKEEAIIPEETQSRIKGAFAGFAETIGKAIQSIMPLIKELAGIAKDIKKMVDDMMRSFRIDPEEATTNEADIDFQINMEDVTPEVLQEHKRRTIEELSNISESALDAEIAAAKAELNGLETEKDAQETQKEKLEYNQLIANAQTKLTAAETKKTSSASRRAVLERRLRLINTKLKLSADDGLPKVSQAPQAPQPAEAPASEGVEQQEGQSAQEKATEEFATMRSKLDLDKNPLSDDELKGHLPKLKKYINSLSDEERVQFLKEEFGFLQNQDNAEWYDATLKDEQGNAIVLMRYNTGSKEFTFEEDLRPAVAPPEEGASSESN